MNSTWSLSPRGFQSSGKDMHTYGPTAVLTATHAIMGAQRKWWKSKMSWPRWFKKISQKSEHLTWSLKQRRISIVFCFFFFFFKGGGGGKMRGGFHVPLCWQCTEFLQMRENREITWSDQGQKERIRATPWTFHSWVR